MQQIGDAIRKQGPIAKVIEGTKKSRRELFSIAGFQKRKFID
jgi:hypothetical protein